MFDIIYTIYIWCIIWIIYTSTLIPELISLFLKNDKIDFDMTELKWIVASLMFFRFFLYTFFLKQFARIHTSSLINVEKILNRPIIKFYNSDDINVVAAELRLTKTRPTSLYKRHRVCSYGSELARLGGLAHLGEISPFLRNSFKKLRMFKWEVSQPA